MSRSFATLAALSALFLVVLRAFGKGFDGNPAVVAGELIGSWAALVFVPMALSGVAALIYYIDKKTLAPNLDLLVYFAWALIVGGLIASTIIL